MIIRPDPTCLPVDGKAEDLSWRAIKICTKGTAGRSRDSEDAVTSNQFNRNWPQTRPMMARDSRFGHRGSSVAWSSFPWRNCSLTWAAFGGRRGEKLIQLSADRIIIWFHSSKVGAPVRCAVIADRESVTIRVRVAEKVKKETDLDRD